MRLAAFKDLTRIEQTFFALPFVATGGFLGWLSTASLQKSWIWLYVIPAFLLARISGMAFNQLIDTEIDAANPRTAKRAIPSGRVTVTQARIVAWGALGLFLLVCMQINTLTALLSPLAAFLLFIYSYMKRIHASCHVVLGCIHFLGPVMAYAALTGSIGLSSILIGGVAFTLMVGTDIVYAIQDYDYDCKKGLFSIPSRLGVPSSFRIAVWLHFLTLLLMLSLGLLLTLPLFYYVIIPVVGVNFFYFHTKARTYWEKNHSLKLEEKRFFYCNVITSFTSLILITGSLIWAVML